MARQIVIPSSGSGPGTSPNSVQSTRISRRETLQESTTSTTSSPCPIWNCLSFPFLRYSVRRKRSELLSRNIAEHKTFSASTLPAFSLCRMEPNIEATPYRWPHDESFDPKTTALIIIDMQMDCKWIPSLCIGSFGLRPHPTFNSSSIWDINRCCLAACKEIYGIRK